MRKSLRTAALTAALSAVALGTASTAMAGTPTGNYAKFQYCPYTNPATDACVYSSITSGNFKLGNADVPITASTPIVVQGGLTQPDVNGDNQFIPAVGAPSLSPTPLKVPGGLLGLMDTGGFSGLLISLFNAAVASVNDVYATAEIAGVPKFNAGNFIGQGGTALTLPLRVHLTNPFLGSSCYIGSTTSPIALKMTTGTTAPPGPNTPITGSSGIPDFQDGGQYIAFNGSSLVDNSFAAPAASNCGYLLLDKIIITAAVNLKEGLPAAAGKNSTRQSGNTYLGGPANIIASIP
jgi:hypothetical protein